MGYPIGDLLGIMSFLFEGAHACQLFENDIMATCKRSKETNLKIWFAEHFNLKRYLIEREVLWKNSIFN